MYRSEVALYPHSFVTQEMRQQEFEEFKTTDDHMMHIIGAAHDENGDFYYILKNSWGKDRPISRTSLYVSELFSCKDGFGSYS